jgi:long-subunit acyl-CoA synthetase (AMP-forming)
VVAGRFDANAVGSALARVQATTTILVPQMLEALCGASEAGARTLSHLRWVAVGGARVAPRLLQRAAAAGLPVYEGYGLSECASVVALNTPEANRAGSVGKPLPHVRLSFGADGEILVGGATLLGYVGDDRPAPDNWPSGDIGHLDADGFLHLHGRKKNLLITSFGRNISPEWLESELCAEAAIAQAVVFGDGRPWPVALIVARRTGLLDTEAYAEIARAVLAVNAGLPEYAHIGDWLLAEAFTVANGQATSNGRPRRDVIWQHYQQQIDSLYEEAPDHVLP